MILALVNALSVGFDVIRYPVVILRGRGCGAFRAVNESLLPLQACCVELTEIAHHGIVKHQGNFC